MKKLKIGHLAMEFKYLNWLYSSYVRMIKHLSTIYIANIKAYVFCRTDVSFCRTFYVRDFSLRANGAFSFVNDFTPSELGLNDKYRTMGNFDKSE